jgi:hypothetical protein
MPLNKKDRVFISVVSRLKILVLVIAALTLVFILVTPPSEIQAATTVLGIALCGLFYMTQRLLSFITDMDFEISRLTDVIKSTLTEEQRQRLFPESPGKK